MSSPIVTRRGSKKAKIQTRSMVKEQDTRKPNTALLEAKKKAREKNITKQQDCVLVNDIYQTAMNSAKLITDVTGLVYDNRMAQHHCLWDPNYPECPERFTRVIERCAELQLLERCKPISSREATIPEILSKHTQEHYNRLKSTSQLKDDEKLEEISSRYDAIYIHPTTFELSLLAVGSTIELIDNILLKNVQNGMAIIRPPGHHAMKSEFNGYCFFNNVAIAAQHALDKYGVKKILIVDWDIHHGQASQRMFYNDPRVLYFSIHRFEYGTFWPNLRESDFDFNGEAEGRGFNFNIPLNKIGMTNGDYLAIFQQILIPVAIEFQPELVIVSAGYDAAYGCPEGEMLITPACYAHLLSPLLTLAEGKVAVVLEGGYCLESLAEGAAVTLKTLLGDPCPLLIEPLEPPCESVQESILNCIYINRAFWKSLQINETYSVEELNNINPQPNFHQVIKIFSEGPPLPKVFPTRNWYPVQTQDVLDEIAEKLSKLKITTNLHYPQIRVCYVYDDIMLEHKNIHEHGHPERPERIEEIMSRFKEYGLFDRLKRIQSRSATTDELCLVHTRQHVNIIRRTAERNELKEIGEKFNSVYFHPKTYECANYAAGSVLQVVDSVLKGDCRSGICVIRPPGHHAESDIPHGFCIFNNIAIAAQYAIKNHGLKRVLIIDWDVHHGNGTQHLFESNPNIMYVSLHRYDYGNFFPKSKDGDYMVVGEGRGEGFNVNIPWNKKGMGDMEYVTAFQRIIMPIAYEFNPELVLVSAGFDAAIGDPLGGCKVTPEAYGYFTHWLSSLANGRIIICLEGGYNVNSVAYAMTMCTKALLGDPLPMLQNTQKISGSCIETIQNVLSVHLKYWKSLKFNKKLPIFNSDNSPSDEINKAFSDLSVSHEERKCADKQENDGNKMKCEELNRDSQPGPSKPADEKKPSLVDYLAENLQALENEEMYAVYPLKNCPHLSTLRPDELPSTLDTKQPCSECNMLTENWFCLGCYKVYCGRFVNEHMLFHHIESDHPLTLSFTDLSVWCYKCESYIDNPCLFKYKNLAHLNKFGEEMLWSYGNDTLVLQ